MLATDQESAREYAKLVKKVTGHAAVLVLSDDPRSSKKIEAFNTGTERWLVAVRQVSEGVDIVRLNVCLWTTSYRTPLFFSQAIGRVVRARNPRESATVFLPAVKPLLALAAEMEEVRNHVVRVPSAEEGLGDFVIERLAPEPGQAEFTALDAEAEFAHLLQGGRAITDEAGEGATWRDVDALRREVHGLVGQWASRSTSSHAEVHVELRKAVPGPPSASAPLEVLLARRDYLLGRVG
jgi:superfamily II DNA or RNA helicase